MPDFRYNSASLPTFSASVPRLVASAERVLEELNRARSEVSALSSSPRGTVRLSSFPSAAVALSAPAIAACRTAHPDLGVHCRQAGAEPLLDYTSDYTVIMSLVEAKLGVSLITRLVAGPLSPDVTSAASPRARTDPQDLPSGTRGCRTGGPAVAAVAAGLREAADLTGR